MDVKNQIKQNIAQHLPHHVTYAPAKFEVATSNGVDRCNKVQDQSGYPDWAPLHFGHEIIVINALIWF